MEDTVEVRHQSRLRTFYYWGLLFLLLVLLDDLMVGWVFWLLAQIHPVVAAVIAFVASWRFGYWLALRGLSPNPGRVARTLLAKLELNRRNPEVQARQEQLKGRIRTTGMAVLMTPLFGGVLSVLWLRRRDAVSDVKARQLAFWLTGMYAIEFMLIHAFGIGGSIFVARQ